MSYHRRGQPPPPPSASHHRGLRQPPPPPSAVMHTSSWSTSSRTISQRLNPSSSLSSVPQSAAVREECVIVFLYSLGHWLDDNKLDTAQAICKTLLNLLIEVDPTKMDGKETKASSPSVDWTYRGIQWTYQSEALEATLQALAPHIHRFCDDIARITIERVKVAGKYTLALVIRKADLDASQLKCIQALNELFEKGNGRTRQGRLRLRAAKACCDVFHGCLHRLRGRSDHREIWLEFWKYLEVTEPQWFMMPCVQTTGAAPLPLQTRGVRTVSTIAYMVDDGDFYVMLGWVRKANDVVHWSFAFGGDVARGFDVSLEAAAQREWREECLGDERLQWQNLMHGVEAGEERDALVARSALEFPKRVDRPAHFYFFWPARSNLIGKSDAYTIKPRRPLASQSDPFAYHREEAEFKEIDGVCWTRVSVDTGEFDVRDVCARTITLKGPLAHDQVMLRAEASAGLLRRLRDSYIKLKST